MKIKLVYPNQILDKINIGTGDDEKDPQTAILEGPLGSMNKGQTCNGNPSNGC